jgi:hypothetical protein
MEDIERFAKLHYRPVPGDRKEIEQLGDEVSLDKVRQARIVNSL